MSASARPDGGVRPGASRWSAPKPIIGAAPRASTSAEPTIAPPISLVRLGFIIPVLPEESDTVCAGSEMASPADGVLTPSLGAGTPATSALRRPGGDGSPLLRQGVRDRGAGPLVVAATTRGCRP